LTKVHSHDTEFDARYLLAGSNVSAQSRAAWKIAVEVFFFVDLLVVLQFAPALALWVLVVAAVGAGKMAKMIRVNKNKWLEKLFDRGIQPFVAGYLLAGLNVSAQCLTAWKIATEVGLPGGFSVGDGKLRLDDLLVKFTDATGIRVSFGDDSVDGGLGGNGNGSQEGNGAENRGGELHGCLRTNVCLETLLLFRIMRRRGMFTALVGRPILAPWDLVAILLADSMRCRHF